MEKKIMARGMDYTYMLVIFREMILKTGIKADENLVWSGCEGPCFAMATFFSFGIRDLGLNLYFAVNSDIRQLWKLEYVKNLGVIATRKEDPVKARVIVLMSGLRTVPFKNVLKFVEDALLSTGVIVGETVVPGLFEKEKWDRQIDFKYVYEFSMENPTSFEVRGAG